VKLPSRASCDFIRVLAADSNQDKSQLLASAVRRQPGMRVANCRGELAHCLEAL
jgi:hypothetical protein